MTRWDIERPDHVTIVAEVGNNHEGDLDVARRLVEQAAAAGVDAVKFQTFRTERFVAPSQKERVARLKRFELPPAAFAELSQLAHSKGIAFLSTPLDIPSVAVLEPLVDAYKVASGDNDFWPLIECVLATGKPVVASTGASDVAQVDRLVSALRSRKRASGEPRAGLLHCVSAYPAPAEEANVASIPFLAERYPDMVVGYSDHTNGIEVALHAVAIGARLIEKHFTLDKNYSDFRDHQLSADPSEMRRLVDGVERVRKIRGRPGKEIQPSEEPGIQAMRRSIAAARDLPQGHRLTMEDLAWLRPAGGVAPGNERELLGRTLARSVRYGDLLRPADLT